MNFAVPADHRVKLKEGEKKDRYLDQIRELIKMWNMKMFTYAKTELFIIELF